MNNILILGSKGMLGSELAKIFPESLQWDREDFNAESFNELKEKITKLESTPSAVINCVAYNNVDEAEENIELANSINGNFVGDLSELCGWYEIPLVHFSTNYVFDGQKGEYQEEDVPNPISVYGQSKFLGEQLLQKNTKQFFLIRTSTLFGTKGQSLQSKTSFLEKILELSNTQSKIDLVADEIFCATLASDLASAVKYLITEKKPYGIYHVTNKGETSWYELAKEMFFFLQKNVELSPILGASLKRKAKRPLRSVLLNTKLYQLQSWPNALREFLVKEYKSKNISI